LATAVLSTSHLSNEPINLERALKIALVHDIVEIDAGDTFLYDEKLNESKFENETKAANRIFGLLPVNGDELKGYWLAYEERNCPESKFVYALDRFLPMMANCLTAGHAWRQNRVVFGQVWEKNSPIENGSRALWAIAKQMLEEAKRLGHLPENY
jgi:putative hydrolase of HD superfamily